MILIYVFSLFQIDHSEDSQLGMRSRFFLVTDSLKKHVYALNFKAFKSETFKHKNVAVLEWKMIFLSRGIRELKKKI